MFFGINSGDESTLGEIKEGVKDFAGKFSFVWSD